jgi:hypothetical protein
MRRATAGLVIATTGILCSSAVAQDWATFSDETSTRLVGPANLLHDDPEEKDYAHGDFDQDGDEDLVVARKQPFTTSGRRVNVLLMNEGLADGQALNGVLVDRTSEFMSAADDGGQGFLDETNDRDIGVFDLDGDGWLDVVTSTAYGQDQPKTISHARIYMNLGEDGGVWQGFRYEEGRIPQLIEAPNTCAVGIGDVTGDNSPDLYFVSYNSSLLEDHLLVNDGSGNFTEESNRLTSGMLSSGFGTGSAIHDMNGDGWRDIVKSENGPVKIHWNNGAGSFSQSELIQQAAHYFVSIGELNNDGKMDLIISDDGQDRYRLNDGNGGDGLANFQNSTFSYVNSGDVGFNGNSVTADLNNDGFNDVLITDVDVDISGCGRRMQVYRNLGNLPTPTLQETVSSGEVVGIPTGVLTGSHDVAVFDINGDGWKDFVLGRCTGTQVYINQPPFGVQFTYPLGLPAFISPDATFAVDLQLVTIGGSSPTPGTTKMFYSIDAGPFQSVSMTDLGDDRFQADLPSVACTSQVGFYFTTDLDAGGSFFDPPQAPSQVYRAMAALGTELSVNDLIEGDTSEWTIIADGLPTDSGDWVQAEPIGSIFGGNIAAPFEDGTAAHEATQAFVTLNIPSELNPVTGDVDGGPFRLLTPTFDLAGTDGTIGVTRWMFSASGVLDSLTTDITNDGGDSWTPIPELTTTGTDSEWESVSFVVSDYITPSADMRVRFTVADLPNDSVTEAGIDNFSVERIVCAEAPPCVGDTDGNGAVDIDDLVNIVLDFGFEGADPPNGGDVNGDMIVDVDDIVEAVLNFGACPGA